MTCKFSLNGDLMKYLIEFGIIHLRIDELKSKEKNNYGNGSSKMNGFPKLIVENIF